MVGGGAEGTVLGGATEPVNEGEVTVTVVVTAGSPEPAPQAAVSSSTPYRNPQRASLTTAGYDSVESDHDGSAVGA